MLQEKYYTVTLPFKPFKTPTKCQESGRDVDTRILCSIDASGAAECCLLFTARVPASTALLDTQMSVTQLWVRIRLS